MEVNCQLHAPVPLPRRKETTGIHWIGGLVGPRTGLGDMERRKILTLPVFEL
jgi:hypothetical protein